MVLKSAEFFLLILSLLNIFHCTKMKFLIKDFFSKCDKIRRKPRIFGHIYWRNPEWKTSFFVQCSSNRLKPWGNSQEIEQDLLLMQPTALSHVTSLSRDAFRTQPHIYDGAF